ncbi:hypothetical protein COURTHOUSE_122 [Mycobacterium phage Courthouse]|uniref:Uncharacterized protein n=2 Tax=Omegavirus courthouse TaxID=1089119 RepID=G8I5H9_9CAUD|nr:hypothetical protein CM09_gp122 [Mycobacterium phage Courthouse]YP_009205257.1 hypothetical protein AVT17_gp127 [Mycobacterium phage Ariel]AER47973.1 hypothetical protein COURTHOUSE_122 [Mycobacterium phage Courthouse]AIM50004.1 hypothetical protein PBI_ARIEL_127 [Mycobacterium phage Ariel]ATS92965.1 hypothetical protein SEA_SUPERPHIKIMAN_124 [Mycobacterium phage Superphikiman]
MSKLIYTHGQGGGTLIEVYGPDFEGELEFEVTRRFDQDAFFWLPAEELYEALKEALGK